MQKPLTENELPSVTRTVDDALFEVWPVPRAVENQPPSAVTVVLFVISSRESVCWRSPTHGSWARVNVCPGAFRRNVPSMIVKPV